MGWDWLRKIGGGIMKGVNWLGQNVGKPILSVAKHVPVIGEVVNAADPLLSTISKGSQWAEDALNKVPASKRRKLPSLSEVGGAIKSARDTVGAATAAAAKLAPML